MPRRPFRFIHASDLHLERPLWGVDEVPDHLRTVFVDAAIMAAVRVFDAVLAEGAEFLVLAGDIVAPGLAGPRGMLVLLEQFHRLSERKIPVYWVGGQVDPPEAWPAAFSLPENVYTFPRGRTAEYVCQPAGGPLARIVGMSHDAQRPLRPDDFEPDGDGLFTLAVAHVEVESAALQTRGVHYWALGGRHDRATLYSSATVAHYSGSPQGRCPAEVGMHGCTLVEVDAQGAVHAKPLATDTVRWLNERLAVDPSTDRDALEAMLRQRLHALRDSMPNEDLLIAWIINGTGPLFEELRRGILPVELLTLLRREAGASRPAAWCVALDVETADGIPAAWFDQETILGDFLRTVRQLEDQGDEPLGLESYLAESHLAGSLAARVAVHDSATRRQILHKAAILGADLLGGGEVGP